MDDYIGICQEGNQDTFREVLDDAIEKFPSLTYVEIGVGSGGTMLWVARYLRSRGVNGWRVIGIDIPEGYSLCAHDIVNGCARDGFYMKMVKDEVKDIKMTYPWKPLINGVTLVLSPAQATLRRQWPDDLPIHVGLIDGCHGVACVTGDFLALEPHVPVGGYALFHDFGKDSSGELQPHCGVGDTQGACADLRLLSNGRATWKFIKHNVADKDKGGFDLGVFKRVPHESAVAGSDIYRQITGQ